MATTTTMTTANNDNDNDNDNDNNNDDDNHNDNDNANNDDNDNDSESDNDNDNDNNNDNNPINILFSFKQDDKSTNLVKDLISGKTHKEGFVLPFLLTILAMKERMAQTVRTKATWIHSIQTHV